MKRKWIIAATAAGLLVATAFLLKHQLSADYRFEQNSLPVLAVPQPQTVDPQTDGAISSFSSPAPTINAGDIDTQWIENNRNIQAPEADAPISSGFNLLLLGIDRRGNESSRTDSIMLAHVNVKDRKLSIVSLPRDTRINVPGVGMTKINHVHALEESKKGNEEATKSVIQAVSNFFQVPIHYFAKTDFNGFVNIIDTIGGIEVNVPVALNVDGVKLSPGEQVVNGKTALALARERYSLPNGDFDRQVDQVMILRSAAERVLTPDSLPKLPSLLDQVRKSIVDTNLSNADLLSLGLAFKGVSAGDVQHVQIKGSSLWAMDPLVGMKLWYWAADTADVSRIAQTYFQ